MSICYSERYVGKIIEMEEFKNAWNMPILKVTVEVKASEEGGSPRHGISPTFTELLGRSVNGWKDILNFKNQYKKGSSIEVDYVEDDESDESDGGWYTIVH